jgi:hypothetical protein
MQFPDVSFKFLPRLDKPRGLFHELSLLLRKKPVKEGSLHVILSDAPVIATGSDRGDKEDNTRDSKRAVGEVVLLKSPPQTC